ncbi:hypothetical protein EYZ11_005639 [Aspergillus tanneri]|uniref:CYTH domain-containing protein n=1 Tax=Aspergillus tanneri TaxID=1220188 RepID=A0A4S3JJT3_9EURO|nr:uncharacterized protein ATNIH1004_005283 [Aspergillus tanneri]KAA8649382.1 hypothetical protein ATNIH1004_005283 [Aspergillus tanneri]THC94877.1 hypothetical protein EYZ11_005639 [Aspergillus tanneri]
MRPPKLVALLSLVAPSSCWPKIKDQVSLQWSICEANPHTVLTKLGAVGRNPDKLDPITYYDTSPPVYTHQGLMFRTKVRGGREISVVKIQPAVPKSHMRHHAKVCRWDRYGDETTFVCKRQDPLKISHLWTTRQRELAEDFQSDITWEKLVGYGPYPNPKWKTLRVEGYRAVLDDVAVQSLHLLELEVKVHRAEEDRAYQVITEYLSAQGVVLCTRQEPKTMRLFRAMGFVTTQDESQDVYTHDL